MSEGLTVVVAPLLSLIADQVESLGRRNVRALHLTSTQPPAETSAVYAELARTPPSAKLLYVTPERLQQSVHLHNCLERLHSRGQLERFVIDEAHCVISWGRDFRPDYLALGQLRRQYGGVPWSMLSATLPPPIRHELLDALNVERATVVAVEAPLDRTNLRYEVWPKLSPLAAADQLAEVLLGNGGAGCSIVYCHSQREAERVCEWLQMRGVAAAFYHAAVEHEVKTLHHQQWLRGEVQVMVATSAFGMGVHKGDVRLVLHWTIPDSILNLYQEWGRAGRDGEPARCVLLYTYRDKGRVESLLRRSPRDLKARLARLLELVELCEEPKACRRARMLRALGQQDVPTTCTSGCDNCAAPSDSLTFEDVTVQAATAVSHGAHCLRPQPLVL